ncbi:MAG: hypothetical protein GX144_02635, partial [Clostridiaceae bacterium]|nr:hypothetical protein [Clostridiaceae bacterium]
NTVSRNQNSNNNASSYRKDYSQRRNNNSRSNYNRSSRNEHHRKSKQRYNTESLVARIANPKREESVDDIRMDIEKLEKDIQFEIKQIRSIKLGL